MSSKDIGIIGKFNVNITIAVIIIVIVASLSFAFAFLPEHRDIISFVAIMIGGGSAIYSAYYRGVALRTRIAQEKVQHAHEFIHLIYSVDLIRLRVKLQDFDHNNITPATQYEEISKIEDVVLALRTSFNLFESLSVAIQLGYVDEVISNRSLDFIIRSMFKTFQPYIDTVRKKNNDALIYSETEKLVHAWDSKKYLFSGNEISNQ